MAMAMVVVMAAAQMALVVEAEMAEQRVVG